MCRESFQDMPIKFNGFLWQLHSMIMIVYYMCQCPSPSGQSSRYRILIPAVFLSITRLAFLFFGISYNSCIQRNMAIRLFVFLLWD